MRILHVGKYYPPYLGGMETVLENLVLGLVDGGHEVSVLVAADGAVDSREFLAETPEEPTRSGSATLTRLARLGVINSQPLTPGLLAGLRKEIARFRPHLLHFHLPNPLLCLSWELLNRLPGSESLPPLLVWHHADITRQKLGGRLVRPLVRRCLDQARGICVSSENLLRGSADLQEHESKTRVIPFGIDPTPWDQVDSSYRGSFVFIGRLVEYKGLEPLLEAMARTQDAQLVLIGEGPLRPRLEALIQLLDLGHRVQLLGALSQTDILPVLNQARALVLPSLDASETFGLVQLEAMAAGLPVVASALSTGVDEVGLEGRSSLLVPPGDISSLSEALGRLQADSELCRQMGSQGRAHFKTHYTRERMINNLLAWYLEFSGDPDVPRKVAL